MASTLGGKVGAIFGDDDYLSLEKLSVRLEKESLSDDGTFTVCFWVYLLKSSKTGVLIRQGRSEAGFKVPFLTIEADRILTLHPLSPPLEGEVSKREDAIVVADQPCAMEKWVHIGCEIGPDIARLHLNGGVVGEIKVDFLNGNEGVGGDLSTVLLSGGDSSTDGSVQGYAHYVRVLPQPTVTNHYVKNPPLELSLDGSSGASDDHEVEEGGDGVWSVVGGKASCRRNFALDVALLDALGRSIHKEMELVALLVYADSGSAVEKPKDDAEAPLLTTFDGVEFPSTERPIKLIHGRASFKLKISQLSSKCDNRLFRVCFDSPSIPHYPFLRAFSRPIRCVSRNRNHRTPAGAWKQKPSNPLFPLDGTVSPVGKELISGESRLGNNDAHSNGTVPNVVGVHVSPFLPGQPPLKRARYQEKDLNGAVYIETSTDRMGVQNGELKTSFSGTFQRPLLPTSPSLGSFGWPVYGHLPSNGPVYKSPTLESNGSLDMMNKQDVIKDNNSLDCGVPEIAVHPKSSAGGFSDLLVFKYCLENMTCRAAFLKAAIMVRNDLDLVDFAGRVSHCTGCRHNGFQILISKKLLRDGNELWNSLSADGHPVSWSILVKQIEESFMKISGCARRSFSSKDQEFLHQIANCGEYISREEFDRLWQWIYPTAVALSSPQLQSTWESENPKWIEGMVSRDEAETLLRADKDESASGTFLLRFANSRVWPHPDAGALVVSYVGNDRGINHKLLTLDVENGTGFGVGETALKPLSEMLLSQPELSKLCRIPSSQPEQTTADMKKEPLSSEGVDAPI